MNKGEIKKGRVYWLAAILIALAVLLSGCKENNSKETTGTNKIQPSEAKEFIPTEYDSTVTVNGGVFKISIQLFGNLHECRCLDRCIFLCI
ncbi:hypothetical protein ABLO26_25820 [Neobacillus sp. 179-J 1A1 HS]|uniref:hypothetical protein n=1 Tax=Neobacillus driksii TaxID=3035913 RepID=UPI0035BBBE75